MTPSELKSHIKQSGDNPYFFTRETMKFFGDIMKNYGVRSTTIINKNSENVAVWELYRKHPVKHNLQKSHYFRKDNFKTEYIAHKI